MFWDHVDKTGDCWLWTAAKDRGYGTVHHDGRTRRAHRVAWLLTYGEWPDSLLDHTCHNADPTCAGGYTCPHRACVNPDHLRKVDQRANLLASPHTFAAKNAAKTGCVNGHEYDEENTYVTKNGTRHCRECHRTAAREYERRKAARLRALNGRSLQSD